MMLKPTSLLQLEGNDRSVRLSYVLEDDSGCRKGLTVARILPGTKPISCGSDITDLGMRTKVFADGKAVGIIDPHTSWDNENTEPECLGNLVQLNGGALTCVFTVSEDVEVSSEFRRRSIFDAIRLNGFGSQPAQVLGEGIAGTMLDELSYAEWGDKSIYPILRLQRSEKDIKETGSLTRNGATVVTADGALIGIVIASFGNGQFYAVAPFRDTLDWHRLRLPAERARMSDNAKITEVYAPPSGDLPKGLDSRLLELIVG